MYLPNQLVEEITAYLESRSQAKDLKAKVLLMKIEREGTAEPSTDELILEFKPESGMELGC